MDDPNLRCQEQRQELMDLDEKLKFVLMKGMEATAPIVGPLNV